MLGEDETADTQEIQRCLQICRETCKENAWSQKDVIIFINFQYLVMTHCVGQVQNIDGQEVSLNDYNGKVVLIVNVASK